MELASFWSFRVRYCRPSASSGIWFFESIIHQYEELIDEMAKRAPNDEMRDRIQSLREKGFEFDKIQENLAKAGAGLATRTDSKVE